MFVEDWIHCETTTTGTGDLTLTTKSGWVPFTQYFASGADGSCDYFEYLVRGADGIPLEAGIGHMSDPTTLVRDHVYKTLSAGTLSTANAAASLAAGTKSVLCADLASTRLRGTLNIRGGATDKLIGDANSNTTTGNVKTLTAGNLYGIPFRCESPALISGAAAYVTTAAASSNIRIALYRLKKLREPGGLIATTGDIVTTGTGKVSGAWASGDRRIPCGDYFLAVKSNGGNPVVFAAQASASLVSDAAWTGLNGSANLKYLYATATSSGSAMPDPCPALSWGTTADYGPRLYLTPVQF